jgi:uncharacterized membrane protein
VSERHVLNRNTFSRRLLLLVTLFAVSGIGHFVMPEPFERIVPRWIPLPRLMVYISGAAELAGAIGLLIPAFRKTAGWGLIVLLVAVFPANINMLQMARALEASAFYPIILWARLPLQPLLIWLVWRAAVRDVRILR